MARADSKAVVGLHANGFASVPQDRRRAPRSLNTASEGLSSLEALGFPKPDLVRWRSWNGFFAMSRSPEQKSMLSSCIDDKE